LKAADAIDPNFKERKLYHQIHPVKLAADIGSAIAFLSFSGATGSPPHWVQGSCPQ